MEVYYLLHNQSWCQEAKNWQNWLFTYLINKGCLSVSVLSVSRRLLVKPMGKIAHGKCLSAWTLKVKPWSLHLEGHILKVKPWRSIHEGRKKCKPDRLAQTQLQNVAKSKTSKYMIVFPFGANFERGQTQTMAEEAVVDFLMIRNGLFVYAPGGKTTNIEYKEILRNS